MLFGAVISFVCLLRISTGSRVILVEDAQTCYRRVVPGSRASSRYVERVVRNAGTLSSCERACFNEPRFHCETFNFRLDPANGGKGGCELMSKPVKEIHPDDLIRDALYDIYEVDRNTLLPDCLSEGSKLKDNRVVKADGSRPPDRHNDTGQHHHYHHHRHHEHEHPHVLYEERREHPYHTKFEHRVHLDRHNYVPYSVGEGHHHQHHHDHHHEHGDREHGYGHGDHDHDHDHEHDDRFDRDGYSHGHGHSRSDEHHWNPTSSEEFDYNSLDHQGRRGPPYGRRYGEGFDDGYSGGGWNDYDRQCSSRRRSGSSLGHSNVRRAIRTSGVLACETACYSESSFKCVSYSYRYSHGFDDNCFLSDRSFASLGFNEDDYSDVFSMDNTRYCEDRHRKKGPWLESECFWLVRSDRRLVDGTSLSVSSLGACQAECVRSKPFFCRSFSFRFGPPTRGDSAFNCVLSPRDGRSLGPHDGPNEGRRGSIETAFGHELYARGSFGRGCEPLIETPSQECFVVYPGGNSGARLKPAAIRASARVANEDDCKHTCYLLDYCMSFSFDSDRLLPSDVDNCFMSDVRLRDLRMGLDYENSIDDWLFAFDMFNPNCWAERKHGDYHHHHHGHRGSAEGHSEPYPPPLYPPLSGPPPPPPGPPLGPPGPSGPLGPGLSIGPLGPPPILPITDLAPPIGPGPIISGPPRPTASDRDLTYAHGFGYGSSGGDYFSGSSGSSGFSGGSGFSGSSGSGIGGGFSSYEDRSYDIYDEGPGSWSVYTVKGYPCRAGTRCAPNHIAGFWSCEIEGGEIGSWDYCCSPAHKCGYSDGVDTPWCYVGDSKSQWRPCSDRYFPYMSQHHHHQHHRDEQDYHHHRLHGESHHSYHSTNELSHGSYPDNADRKYWDDLYKNGPQSYYDERGNPRPGYVWIPTMDKTHIHYHHNYGPDKSGDQRWIPVKPPSYENPQDFLEPPRPGGFDIPRYWPVAYLHREKPPNGTFDDRLNSIGDRDGHRKPDYRDRDRDYDRREYEDRRRPGYDDRRGSGERHPTYDDRRPSYDDRRPGQDDRRPGQDDRRPGHDDRRPGYDDRRPNTRPEQDNKRRPSIADKKPDEKNKTRNDGDSSKSNSDSKNRNTTVAPSSTPSDSRNGRKDEEDITNASVAESSNTDDVMVLISSSSDDRNTTDNPAEDTEKSSIKVGTDDKSVTRRSDDNAWPVAHGIRDQLEFFDDDEANIEVISLGEQKRSTQKTNAELLDSEVRQIEEIGRFLGAKQRGLLVEKRSQNENDARQLVTSQQRNATAMNRATIQRISKEQLRKERQRPESPETETTESAEAMIVNGKQFFDATIDEETTRLEQIRNRTTMFKQRKGRRPPYDPKEARLRLQEHRNRQNA